MLEVKDGSNVQRTLASVQRAMTLDIAGSTIDDMCHGLAWVGVVGIVVDNGGRVYFPTACEGPEAFIPMNVSRRVSTQTIQGDDQCSVKVEGRSRTKILTMKREAYPER